MIDLYLIASTEADMVAALLTAYVASEDGFPVSGISLDHIGPFSRLTGYDKVGDPIMIDHPGWHTNLRGNFTDEQLAVLTPLSVEPATPYRVWA